MRIRVVPVIAVLALSGLVLAGCGDDEDTATTGSTTTVAGSTSSSAVADGDGSEQEVLVYFARDEGVAAGGRTVAGPAVATGALEALLAGPDDLEVELGMGTEIPPGSELLGLDIADGLATVDLSADFASGGGSLSMQLRAAQVVFTLTRFDTVDAVTFHIDGEPIEGLGGEGIPATDVDRGDFENVTPLILVESPVPGQAVTSPVEIAGMANTFEATVSYTVTDGDGLIVGEGFTTATAGNGTWGTFEVSVDFEYERAGMGSVVVYQEDMESGGPRDVYEVPIALG